MLMNDGEKESFLKTPIIPDYPIMTTATTMETVITPHKQTRSLLWTPPTNSEEDDLATTNVKGEDIAIEAIVEHECFDVTRLCYAIGILLALAGFWLWYACSM